VQSCCVIGGVLITGPAIVVVVVTNTDGLSAAVAVIV
jgi:hypothetical protein